MLRLRIASLLLCSGVCVTAIADSAEIEWELQRDKNGVQVYTGTVVDSSFKAVKTTAVMSTTVAELAALVRDVDACGEWAAFCAQATVIEARTPTDMLVYTLNDMPWPVSDRDAVTRVVWSQEAADASVVMTATVVDSSEASGELAEQWGPKKGKVRLSYGVTQWTFTPQPAPPGSAGLAQVAVSSYAHVNPGGAVPAWLTNRLLVDAPHDTVVAMRKLVQTGRYADTGFTIFE